MTTRTYRGRSLEELLPRVRAELGPDAVIVRQREGLTGGVGGFFQRKLVEIEAAAADGAAFTAAPGAGFSVTDDTPATPDFLEQLTQAQAAAEAFVPDPVFERGGRFARDASFEADGSLELPATVEDDAWSAWGDPDAAAPEVQPFVSEQVDALPAPDGAFDEWGEDAQADEPGPEPEPASLPVPFAPPAPRAELTAPWPEEAAGLRDALVHRGLGAELADAVLEETVTHLVPFGGQKKLKPLVTSALARRIPVKPLGGLAGRVVAFVGPGGSGKTHCAGRLATAYAAASRMDVACVALRPRDAGAELALLLATEGVPLHAAATGAEAAERAGALRGRALVLVDTPGVSPRAKGELRALHAELRALGADDVLLTLPATSSAGAARELVAGARRLGASGVVLTHADETEHLGPAVAVAMESGLPFAYVGEAGGLKPAAGDELAAALLSRAATGPRGASSGAAARR